MTTCIYPTITDGNTDVAIIHVWCNDISDRNMENLGRYMVIGRLCGQFNNNNIFISSIVCCNNDYYTGRYDR